MTVCFTVFKICVLIYTYIWKLMSRVRLLICLEKCQRSYRTCILEPLLQTVPCPLRVPRKIFKALRDICLASYLA